VTHPNADQIAAGYSLLSGDGGSVIGERDVVTVSGPDSARYLQGQLSQDVVAMNEKSVWSFLLAPTGKVNAWLRVHRIDAEKYFLETDVGWGDAVVTRLQRFLLRTRAEISQPRRCQLLQIRWSAELLRLGESEIPNAIVATPIGPGVAGVDALFLESQGSTVSEAYEVVPEGSYSRYRLAHGIPSMGTELTDETIPGEVGTWVIDASVSFTKGCYTGQELVARIDSRGNNVPAPIRLLVFESHASVGDGVWLDGNHVGEVTSAVPSLGEALPALGLARVKRSVVPGSFVQVGSDRVAASVVEPGTVR